MLKELENLNQALKLKKSKKKGLNENKQQNTQRR